MSHISSFRRHASAGAATALALVALPASASADAWAYPTAGGATPAAACTNPTTTKAFAKFGDSADYALAPDGNFELGGKGWTFENAKIVSGNDTTGVATGRQSVLLGVSRYGGAASITSPEFCVTKDHPTFRAVVKSTGNVFRSGFGSNIEYRLTTALGTSYLDLVAIQGARSAWTPTDVNPLATAIPDTAFAKGVLVRIKYYLPSYNVREGGQLQIDNVMIDPYRRS